MILLTGGTGLVGSQLLFDLAASGQMVRALKRRESSMLCVDRLFDPFPSYRDQVEWIEGDVNDIFSVEDAMSGVDTIYHSAALVSFYPRDRSRMQRVNAEGTANMVNIALYFKVKQFCYVSSTAALGRVSDGELLDENSWWKTSKENSYYAISKYCGEREVWRGMEEGLNAFIINPSIVIGPGNWHSGSSHMFSQIWKGMPFYTDGLTGFVDVRDVSRAAIALMKKGISNQRYIINAENTSYRYVFDLIAENLGRKKAAIRIKPWMGEVGWRLEKIKSLLTNSNPMITRETARSGFKKWSYSSEKIKKELDMEFIPVRESVAYTSKYFLDERK